MGSVPIMDCYVSDQPLRLIHIAHSRPHRKVGCRRTVTEATFRVRYFEIAASSYIFCGPEEIQGDGEGPLCPRIAN